MDYIEYVQIFISLVFGLAFTRIIKSYAVIINNASRIKFYWPYFSMSLGLLLFVINDFWTGFARNRFLNNSSGLSEKITFVYALITPLCYTLIAELLHPKISESKIFDLKERMVVARKTAYIIGTIGAMYAVLNSFLIGKTSSTFAAQTMRIFLMTIFITGVIAKNELIQKIIAVLFFLTAVIWFFVENEI